MNETNRTAIVFLAALWIVLMAVVIFAAWAADVETVERLQDFVSYLDDHRDNASRLILTLGALVLIVLSLLVIIVELAPEEEERQIRVEHAGATTIVPAEPLRLRLEEALTAVAQITAARVRVFSQNKGIGMKLDLTVTPDTNIAAVREEASRVVTETLKADLGLPVSAPRTVRIAFGPRPAGEPVASSVAQPPIPPQPEPPPASKPPFPGFPAPATPADEPAPRPEGAPPAAESAPQDEVRHDEPPQR
ncbi:MAG: hypothetical protein A2Y74_03420 [Actinobacteria bacterium RBG_13_63_9]|nr:MAG: hypothetical protein A2Y74_03420 [Actinobacteria bacterium RBG_13_63_9]